METFDTASPDTAPSNVAPPNVAPPRSLQHWVCWLRYLAYGWHALLLLGLWRGSWLGYLGAAGLLGWAWCCARISPVISPRPEPALPYTLELLLTPILLGLLLPWPLALAGTSLLLAALLVLQGFRWSALALLVVGVLLGQAGAWLLVWAPPPTALTWPLVSAALLLWLLPLSLLSGLQATRLQASRLALRQQALHLAEISQRLGLYLPSGLVAQLTGQQRGLPALQRRWLCVCFVDLQGFASLSLRLAPEALAQVLDGYLALTASLVSRYQGSIDKFLGDGVLLVFGEPYSQGRGQDATRALACLQALAPALAQLDVQLQHQGLEADLQIRAGMAAGFCTLGDFGSAQRRDYCLLGPAVNLASRLQQLAAAGELCLDAASQTLLASQGQLPAALRVQQVQVQGWVETLRVGCLPLSQPPCEPPLRAKISIADC